MVRCSQQRAHLGTLMPWIACCLLSDCTAVASCPGSSTVTVPVNICATAMRTDSILLGFLEPTQNSMAANTFKRTSPPNFGCRVRFVQMLSRVRLRT